MISQVAYKFKQAIGVYFLYKMYKEYMHWMMQLVARIVPTTSKHFGPPRGELKGYHDVYEYARVKHRFDHRYYAWCFAETSVYVPDPRIVLGHFEDSAMVNKGDRYGFEYLYQIPNCRVYFHNFFLVTEDDNFLSPVSHFHSIRRKCHPCFSSVKLPTCTFVKGKSLILRAGAYFHTFLEGLPSIYLFEMLSGLNVNDLDNIVIFELDKADYISIFTSVGVAKEKILVLDERDDNYEFELLFVPSYMNRIGLWYRNFLIERFLGKLPDFVPSTRKIYVSRSKTRNRRVLNETDVIALLKTMGFEVVYNEDLSIPEQIRIYMEATHIISPHGSNLVNIAFCQPGVKVLEIRFKEHTSNYKSTYMDLTHYAQGIYYLLYCDQGKPFIRTNGKEDWVEADMYVDLKDLNIMLDAMAC
jgi:hypothetical protein